VSIDRSLNATALHARTADLCTTNLWLEEGGFTVPAAYTSMREEQWALAERAALCDLSARQIWSFHGADAASFLSFATIDDAAAMAASRVQETYWCDDMGFVRGKGTLLRRGATGFELMTPVRDLAWLLDGAHGFDVAIGDVTAERAVVGVAGPLAPALLADAGLTKQEMHPGDVAEVTWRSARVSVIRLNGTAGFELLTPAEDAIVVWDRLWRCGREIGIGGAGAQALELSRIEAGRMKPGVDWLPAQAALTDDDFRLPQDLGASPNLARRFNGVEALRRASASGRAVAVQFVGPQAVIPGVLPAKELRGRITSVAWSEARGEAVALGWLDPAAAKPGATLSAPGPSGPVEVRVAMAAVRET
jgi:aminomethyltransferase